MADNKNFQVMTVNGVNEVITTNTEHAQELVDSFFSNGRKGMELFLHNCENLAELRGSKGYLLLGYKSFYCDGGKADTPLLKALGFDSSSDTEAKNMCLVATKFGDRQLTEDGNPDNVWKLSDRTIFLMSQLSKGILYELPSLMEAGDGKADVEEVLKGIGVEIVDNTDGMPCVMSKLTVDSLRTVKRLERQFKKPYFEALEDKEKALAEAEAKKAEREATETETTEPTETESTEPTGDNHTNYSDNPLADDIASAMDKTTKLSLKEARNLIVKGSVFVLYKEDGSMLSVEVE